MERFIYDVLVGLIVAFVLYVIGKQWPRIRSVFDKESRRQAEQIAGKWDATEIFADGTEDAFILQLECTGGNVSGMHECRKGFDADQEFNVNGTYKDQVLAFTWMPKNQAGLESGTVTAKLVQDRKLEGYGLYIEPTDGKVYTSRFVAVKKA